MSRPLVSRTGRPTAGCPIRWVVEPNVPEVVSQAGCALSDVAKGVYDLQARCPVGWDDGAAYSDQGGNHHDHPCRRDRHMHDDRHSDAGTRQGADEESGEGNSKKSTDT